MKCFIAIEEELLLKLWAYDPTLVAPFSRPFYPQGLNQSSMKVGLEAQDLILSAENKEGHASKRACG